MRAGRTCSRARGNTQVLTLPNTATTQMRLRATQPNPPVVHGKAGDRGKLTLSQRKEVSVSWKAVRSGTSVLLLLRASTV